MDVRDRGEIRHSQLITTFGVGSLVDFPTSSAIVAGLEHWRFTPQDPKREIVEPRLSHKLAGFGAGPPPKLFAPPQDSEFPPGSGGWIKAFRFPEWFVEQKPQTDEKGRRFRALVPLAQLDSGKKMARFEREPVVAVRFVRACIRGHLDDLDWRGFVHQGSSSCVGRLRLREQGTSGDLSDQRIVCDCGKSRPLAEAQNPGALGRCTGRRPWLGKHTEEDCELMTRLLIRTATNAWFPQILSVLSLPNRGSELDGIVSDLWTYLQGVTGVESLTAMRHLPQCSELADFPDELILAAIEKRRKETPSPKPSRHAELEAFVKAPEGYGEEVPVDPDFHAQCLPDSTWNSSVRASAFARIVQDHRLREVMALGGFTRFEAPIPGIDGEYETDVERAALAVEPKWFPAVENRGEGVFLQLDPDEVAAWQTRPAVCERVAALENGQILWNQQHKAREFPVGPYLLLHTLAHLLLKALALHCGYPAASLRERLYLDADNARYGFLLYTASPDAEGTLGGLTQQAKRILDRLEEAVEEARFCSNDPICAHHQPGNQLQSRLLHGASCHGCTLISESSCEMRNEYLDRALVVPVLGQPDAAFFRN